MKGISFVWKLGLFLIAICLAMGMSQGTTYSYSPATNTWTNDNTPTFTFNQTGALKGTINCHLVIDDVRYGNYSSPGAYVNREITANGTLTDGLKSWVINCTNSTNTEESTARNLFVDATNPSVDLDKPVNGLNSTTSSITFNITVSQLGVGGEVATCYFYLNGVLNKTATMGNNTVYNHTINVYDGTNIPFYWTCTDNASNTNTTSTRYINVDANAPTITINSPVNNSNLSTSININWTATDAYHGVNCSCDIYYTNQTDQSVYDSALVINSPTGEAQNLTLTGFDESGVTYHYNVTCNDTWGNTATSGFYYFVSDDTEPTIETDTFVNLNQSSGNDIIANLTFVAVDANTTISNCGVIMRVANQSGTWTVSGTLNETAKRASCEVIVDTTYYVASGQFSLEPYAYDTSGSTVPERNVGYGVNQSNWTAVKLYAGWNLVQIDRNTTLEAIGNWSDAITSVSYYFNSNHTTRTYVNGLTTNSDTSVADGEVVYIRINSSVTAIYLHRYWTIDSDYFVNITLSKGWNIAMAYNNTGLTLEELCSEDYLFTNLTIAEEANITYVTMYDASASTKYKSHYCGYTYYATERIPKGLGYWILVDANVTQERYRG